MPFLLLLPAIYQAELLLDWWSPAKPLTSFPESPKLYLLGPLICVPTELPKSGEGKPRGRGWDMSSNPALPGQKGGYSQLVLGAQKLQDWGRVDVRRGSPWLTQEKMDGPPLVTSWLRGQEKDKFQKEREAKIQTG